MKDNNQARGGYLRVIVVALVILSIVMATMLALPVLIVVAHLVDLASDEARRSVLNKQLSPRTVLSWVKTANKVIMNKRTSEKAQAEPVSSSIFYNRPPDRLSLITI